MSHLINTLFDTIISRVRHGKVVVYFLAQPVRIGQIVAEMYALKSVYPPDEHQIIAVVPDDPASNPRMNEAAFKVSMRDVDVIVPPDEAMRGLVSHLAWYGLDNDHVRDFDMPGVSMRVIFGRGGPYILHALTRHLLDARPGRPLTLDGEDLARGNRLERALGLDPAAEVVTLHVRESGYLPEGAHLNHRDASIANYLPAIEFLLEQGYAVVRLGDPSMVPLSLRHPRLVDAPFHPAYQRHGDVYFSARSAFMVHTLSGPTSLAIAFGRPSLASNATPFMEYLRPGDVLLPKTAHLRGLDRPLTFPDLVTLGLVKCTSAGQFKEMGAQLEECGPDILLEGVAEMHRRHRGTFLPSLAGALANATFRQVSASLHAHLDQHPGLRAAYENDFGPAVGLNLAEAFIARRPDFLEGGMGNFPA